MRPGMPTEYTPHKSWETQLLEDVSIGIVSLESRVHLLTSHAQSWWDQHRFSGLVYVILDHWSHFSPSHSPIFVSTGCDSDNTFGGWCRMTYLLRMWKSKPFERVKWFVRIGDETYAQLENLHHLVSKYDHRVAMVIGEKYCSGIGIAYPSGSAGFILSRGFIDQWNERDWGYEIVETRSQRFLFDDVLMGAYLTRKSIEITNYLGIVSEPIRPELALYRYWMNFLPQNATDNAHANVNTALHTESEPSISVDTEHSFELNTVTNLVAPITNHDNYREIPLQAKLWDMPFRPTLLNVRGQAIPLHLLHATLHALAYSPTNSALAEDPPCMCWEDMDWKKMLLKPSCYLCRRL